MVERVFNFKKSRLCNYIVYNFASLTPIIRKQIQSFCLFDFFLSPGTLSVVELMTPAFVLPRSLIYTSFCPSTLEGYTFLHTSYIKTSSLRAEPWLV